MSREQPQRLLAMSEAARLLNVSRATLRNMAIRGDIEFVLGAYDARYFDPDMITRLAKELQRRPRSGPGRWLTRHA
ncbi:MAG: hypothetical protein JWL65_5373 [Gammaproteobacteria bacterium]|nr:hypothetical protein [Gammaproteobacteria bacterium]